MALPDILPVTPQTLPLLQSALEALSKELGDIHRTDAETMGNALFGPSPACFALLAQSGANPAGAALYSPVMSTTMGGPGAFVSDLWVAPGARGQALGPRLLTHAARHAAVTWQARFLWLISYNDNFRSLAFYDRLGFRARNGETRLSLTGQSFDNLRNS